MNIEIFKDVPNYEGLYQVSNFGNIKSKSRIVERKKSGNFLIKESIIKQFFSGPKKYQYLKVTLTKDGIKKNLKVHVLVAMAFLGHKPDGTHKIIVEHFDGNRLNNNLKNLELTTQSINIQRAYKKIKTSSIYTGVSFNKRSNKWLSYIKINNKRKHLGCFNTEIEAYEAYQKAFNELNN